MAWQRIKKRWLLLAATVIAIAMLFVVAHRVLRSQVAAQLTGAFGGEAEIGSVSLGMRWHEARNVRLRSESSDQRWLAIDRVRFELPLFEAVTGNVTPRRLEVMGLESHLRLNENGRLIEPRFEGPPVTDGPLPKVSILDARVLVRKLDQQPVAFDSIDAVIESVDGVVIVTGEAGDSPLGALAGKANYDMKSGTLAGSIESTSLRFDTNALPDLPLSLPAISAWQENEIGRARGAANASVSFAMGESGQFTYRAELQISAAEIWTAANEFHITRAAGRVVVEDNVVTLSDCRANFATGNVEADGMLDLGSRDPSGEFNVRISGVTLPIRRASVAILPGLTGVTSGGLNLKLRRNEERWILSGAGDARLDDAVWKGLPLDTLTASLDLERWQLGATNRAARATGRLQLGFALVDAQLKQLAVTFSPANDQLAESVVGVVSMEGRLEIPLQTAPDPTSYWADASVSSQGVTIAKTRCGPLSAKATLRDGRIRFEDAELQFSPNGRAVISGDVAMSAGESRLGLVLERVPLQVTQPYFKQGTFEKGTFEKGVRLAGDINASLSLTVPSLKWHAPALWQLTGSARSDALSWNDVTLQELSASVSYADKELRLQDARCQLAGISLSGDGSCGTVAPFPFNIRVKSSRVVLEQLLAATEVESPFPIAGVASGQGQLSGACQPLRWAGTGTARVEKATLGDVAVSEVTLPWKIDSDKLEFADASALLFGGRVHATAVIPWHDTASSRIEGRFDSWDGEMLSQRISQQSISLKGTGTGRFSAQHILSPEKLQAELSFAGVDATIDDLEFRQLNGRFDVDRGSATVKLGADMLDGTCSFQGQLMIDPADWRPHQIRGMATLSQISLQKLWPVIGQRQRYGPLHAVADAELDVQLTNLDSPAVARGSLKLGQVRWGNVPITREMSAKMILSKKQLRVEDARLRIDQGAIVGAATIDPNNGRGEFQLRVEQVPLGGLMVLTPDLARGARGKVNGEFTGSLGDRWDAVGVLRLDRGSVAGVPLTAVRLPLRVSRVPDSGRTRLDVELQSARIASGKAKGRLQLFWSGRFSVQGKAELTAANLRPISKAVPGVSDLLGGQISAKVDFKSGNLRSIEDLIANFDVRLKQSPSLLLPGLKELATAVGAPSPGAVTFSETTMRGDLKRGIVKLDQMTMASSEKRVWINGKMDLQGTLDFEVAADTGSLSTVNLVAAAVNPIQILRRRLLFFNLEGSLRNPIVRPRTEEFLAQEVIFFFLPVVSLR